MSSFLFESCDSPLSDVEFDDPSVINPYIRVFRDETTSGINSGIWVYLHDKNFQLIELKNGKVTANNIELITDTVDLPQPFDSIFENGKIYITPENFSDVIPNSNYTIDITLNADKTYSSNITTQNKYVFFNVPVYHFQSTDMNINWEIDNQFETTIKISYTYISNTGNKKEYINSFKITGNDLTSGTFTIDKSNFKVSSEPYDAIIGIENDKPGQINTNFGEKSIFHSVFGIEKISHINSL
ncbi:MAG: hypothetical protein GXO79_11935 [Chlorobi bacterium]|nr:hypothetical protein [Chlorobiota bacterium]